MMEDRIQARKQGISMFLSQREGHTITEAMVCAVVLVVTIYI